MIALINLTKNDPKPPIRKREAVKKHKFKVGDRVVYNAVEFGNTDLDGKIGTIVYVDSTAAPYTVSFDDWRDEYNGVHDLRAEKGGAKYPPFTQWFCAEQNLTKIK